MTLRPDERAVESEIRRDQEFRKNVGRGVEAVASIGAATGLAGVSSKVLPFLNKFIPADLAMKGLSKVSLPLANFLKRGQSMGLNIEEGIQYLRDSLQPKEAEQQPEQQQKPKENRNIIEQYSPELHQFMSEEVKKGRAPIEAGALAEMNEKYSKVIKKLIQDHRTPWSNIVESIYGTGEYGGAVNPPNSPQQQQAQMPHPNSAKGKQLAQQQTQQQAAPTPGQSGSGQQALMDILQRIEKIKNAV